MYVTLFDVGDEEEEALEEWYTLDSGCALHFRQYCDILLQYSIYCCNMQYIAIYWQYIATLLKYAIYCNMRNANIAIIAMCESAILQYIWSS